MSSHKTNIIFKNSDKFKYGSILYENRGFLLCLKFEEKIKMNDALLLSSIIGFGKYNFFNGRNVVYYSD